MSEPTVPETQAGTLHLGATIRARRRQLGLTQAALAAQIGKSPSYISAVESGSTAPSLTTLRHLARALGAIVADFFEPPAHAENGVGAGALAGAGDGDDWLRLRVVRPETRKRLIDPSTGNVRWELISPDLQHQMEVVQMTMAPGAVVGGDEWMLHAGEECGLVLDGSLEIEFEQERFVLEAGDSLYFPSTRPHRIRNRSDSPTVAIWIITPPSF